MLLLLSSHGNKELKIGVICSSKTLVMTSKDAWADNQKTTAASSSPQGPQISDNVCEGNGA
jgi:hypothetical protein